MGLRKFLIERVARRIDPEFWEYSDAHSKGSPDAFLLVEQRRSREFASALIRAAYEVAKDIILRRPA